MNKLELILFSLLAVFFTLLSVAIVVLTVAAFLSLTSCGGRPASTTLSVGSVEFVESTRAAMDIIEGFVGCDFLRSGSQVLVKSDDGSPCDDSWRVSSQENGKDATSYKCDRPVESSPQFEILVSRPGDIHTQTCIIAHELGHVMGLKHASRGIMSGECGSFIRVLDADSEFLRAKYCRSE